MNQKIKNAIWGAIALVGGMIIYDIIAYFF